MRKTLQYEWDLSTVALTVKTTKDLIYDELKNAFYDQMTTTRVLVFWRTPLMYVVIKRLRCMHASHTLCLLSKKFRNSLRGKHFNIDGTCQVWHLLLRRRKIWFLMNSRMHFMIRWWQLVFDVLVIPTLSITISVFILPSLLPSSCTYSWACQCEFYYFDLGEVWIARKLDFW